MSIPSLLRLFVLSLLLLFWVMGTSLAMRPSVPSRDAKVIYAGRGVAGAWIGEPPSGGYGCGDNQRGRIRIECAGRNITKISIADESFYVEKLNVRVSKSGLDDVIRYYGYGEQIVEKDGITLRYSSQGISFKMDPSRERIIQIIIFNPLRSIDKEFREQLKKKK